MKLLWTGSDTLYATRFLGGRKFPTKKIKYIYFLGVIVFAKIADKFVECHYVVAEHLKENLKPLKLKKEIKILVDPPKYTQKFRKKKHDGFNILYYRCFGSNMVYKNWVYGYDIMKGLSDYLQANWVQGYNDPDLINGFNIIEVNGNNDMSEIYPIIDVCIRPNRGDGMPRMIMECETNDIPYYWSKETPNINDIIEFIKKHV